MRRALGIAAFAGIALGLWLAAARRTVLAEWLLERELAARGVAPAALRVVRLDAAGLELRDVALGAPDAPDLSIERIDADWSWRGLLQRRLDALRVSGVRLRATLGDEGVTTGALDPLWRGGGAGGVPRLPAPEIELRDARAAIDTLAGAAEAELAATLHAAPDGTLAGDFAATLADAQKPARLVPLALTGHLAGPPADLGFDARLADPGGRLRIEAQGRLDLVARGAHAMWRLAPLVLAKGGVQPEALAPLVAPLLQRAQIPSIAGRVEARGSADLEAGTARLALDLALRDVAFESRLARVSGLNGTIALHGPPLGTAPGQLVSIAVIDPGIPLTDGLLEFQLREGGVLAVHRAEWHWAGGTLAADELLLDPRAAESRAVLMVRGVDLAALLAQLNVAGLVGSGRIEGELPLVRDGDAIAVGDGVLRAAEGGGTLRYQPTESARALAASRPNDLGLAFDALSDFRYELLEAHLTGDLQGDMKIRLHLRGANPSFQEGRPVEFNLELEARLADLVRSGLASYRVPEVIEERLRAFSAPEGR
jgi:hypothetical protein